MGRMRNKRVRSDKVHHTNTYSKNKNKSSSGQSYSMRKRGQSASVATKSKISSPTHLRRRVQSGAQTFANNFREKITSFSLPSLPSLGQQKNNNSLINNENWMEIAVLKKISHKNIIKLHEFINAEVIYIKYKK